MYFPQPREITLSDILGTLRRYRARCVVTAILVLAAAAAYAVFAPPMWEASQAIVVRDSATTHFGAAARGRSEDATKNTQQTLQEMLASWTLLKDTLIKAGPPSTAKPSESWPSDKDVDSLRTAVSLAPPKGVDFGKTDVFYLRVKDHDRARALTLTETLYADLEKSFGELRANIAQSEIAELQDSVALAEDNLARTTQRLAEIEKKVGVDLVALRMLHQSPTGDTYLFRALTGAVDELRQTKANESQQTAMLEMLKKGKENPLIMTAAPRELLDCHAGLARLIQGLAESRLRSFAEAGRLTEEHCDIKALRREEAGVREGIRQELAAAIQGVSATQQMMAARRATLETLVAGLNARLARLTDVRAEYSNLVNQVEHRRNLVEESQRTLAQARASFTGATASSVLSRMDQPDGGLYPVSASRTMIGLGGLLASVLGGVGIVFLTAPINRREDPLVSETAFMQTPRPLRKAARRKVASRYAEPVAVGAADGNGNGNG